MGCAEGKAALKQQNFTKEEEKVFKKLVKRYKLSWDQAAEAFHYFPPDRRALTKSEFEDFMMKTLGQDTNKEAAIEYATVVYTAFDLNEDNTIDVAEFLALVGVTKGESVEEKLQASFRLFDKNKDGKLTKEEILPMLRLTATTIHKYISNTVSSEKELEEFIQTLCDDIFDNVDTNKDGYITEKEFMKGFEKFPDVCGVLKLF